MNNKTLLGLFVFIFIIVGAVWFIRKNLSFLDRFSLPFAIKSSPTPTPQPEDGTANNSSQAGAGSGTIPEGSIPSGLLGCTAQIRLQSCNNIPVKPVCGYNKRETSDGKATVEVLTYNTACHYCTFFSDDGVLQLGTTTLTSLGYLDKPCGQ